MGKEVSIISEKIFNMQLLQLTKAPKPTGENKFGSLLGKGKKDPKNKDKGNNLGKKLAIINSIKILTEYNEDKVIEDEIIIPFQNAAVFPDPMKVPEAQMMYFYNMF